MMQNFYRYIIATYIYCLILFISHVHYADEDKNFFNNLDVIIDKIDQESVASSESKNDLELVDSTLRREDIEKYLIEKRQKNEDIFITADLGTNFRALDLSKIDFSGVVMVKIDLSNSNLSEAIFDNVYAEASNFNYANLTKASFKNAYISNSTFNFSILDTILFENCNAIAVKMKNTTMKNLIIKNSNFYNSTFDLVTINQVQCYNILLSKSYWQAVVLQDCSFKHSNLSHMILDEVEVINSLLDNIDLHHSTIMNSSFSNGSKLLQINFADAKVTNNKCHDTLIDYPYFFNSTLIKNEYLNCTIDNVKGKCPEELSSMITKSV